MARRENDEFNFVGLARSPVKQTPHAGYYDRGAPSTTKAIARKTLSAALKEGMDTPSTGINEGYASFQRRRALRVVPANVIDTSADANADDRTTALSHLSSTISSISSRKVELAKRSRLPVSRTLKLSPTTASKSPRAGLMGMAASSRLTESYPGDTEQESSSRGLRRNHFSTETASRDDSAASPKPPSTVTTPAAKTQNKEYIPPAALSPLSLCRRLAQSQFDERPSATPIAEDPCVSLSLTGLGSCIHGSDDGNWSDSSFSRAVFSPEPATSAVFSTANVSSSCSRHRVGPSVHPASSQRVGLTQLRASVTSDLSPIGGTDMHGYVNNTGLAATEVGNSNPRSIIQRSACDDESGAAGIPSAIVADRVGPDALFGAVEIEAEDEDGESDEARDLFPDEPSQASMQVNQQARSASSVLESTSLLIAPESMKRSVMSPRRPIAASALSELSDGTPRGMIRGIIGRVGQPGRHRQQQQQQQQRFVPRVARVAENTEEETPRRFIKGVLACTSNDAATAFSVKTTSVSVAAAKAAAAAAAASATAGVLLGRPRRHPVTQENLDYVQNGATEDIDIVATTPEVAEAPVPETIPPSPVEACEGTAGAERVAYASAGGIGKALFNTVLFINAIALLVVFVFALLALLYLYLAEPLDRTPIY